MSHEIKVEEIEIIPVKPKDGLIGFASFILNQTYYVGSVAIFTRMDGRGFRLVYPTKKLGERNMYLFHPITVDAGRTIEEAVTEKVNELLYGKTT